MELNIGQGILVVVIKMPKIQLRDLFWIWKLPPFFKIFIEKKICIFLLFSLHLSHLFLCLVSHSGIRTRGSRFAIARISHPHPPSIFHTIPTDPRSHLIPYPTYRVNFLWWYDYYANLPMLNILWFYLLFDSQASLFKIDRRSEVYRTRI